MKRGLQTSILRNRLVYAAMWLAIVVIVGALGFHAIGHEHWTWGDCVYFTIITLSTVGFGETLPGLDSTDYGRAWTVGLIVLGSGTLLYFISTLTAFIVEGDLQGALRRNRMQSKLNQLSGHYIVCGGGTTGIHVVEEFLSSHMAFCVVDTNEARLLELAERFGPDKFLFIVGDASDDETLKQAGIERAIGVIAALHEDKDNLFVVVTASALNPKLRIVAKAVEVSARAKLLRAGAKAVVSPTQIGGMRLASEAIRPKVVEFLDLMLRDPKKNLRIEEVTIPEQSSIVGCQLNETEIRRKTKVLVIALRYPDGRYEYNPPPEQRIEPGCTMIVLAETVEMSRLRDGIASGAIGRAPA
ncbi:MAG: potassium channel protein [Myxococcota bacterium]|nr:potassium channel protein [Myxococcota bacterium]